MRATTFLDLFMVGMLEPQIDGLFQIFEGFFWRRTLAGNVQLDTLGDMNPVFLPDAGG